MAKKRKKRVPRPKSLKGLKGGLRAYWKKRGGETMKITPALLGRRKIIRRARLLPGVEEVRPAFQNRVTDFFNTHSRQFPRLTQN